MITAEQQPIAASAAKNAASIRNLLRVTHYADAKGVRSAHDFRTFTARFISYQPFWLKLLYSLRQGLLKLLRVPQKRITATARINPEDISFIPGRPLWFFTVRQGDVDRKLVLKASNTILIAYLIITREDLPESQQPHSAQHGPVSRYSVTTLVRYRNFAGRCYFNIIRPMHHLVVAAAIHHAAAGSGYTEPYRPRIGFMSISEAKRS